MEEIWKDIPGYEGYYQVSNMGNVSSLDREVKGRDGKVYLYKGKELYKRSDDYGYYSVTLSKNSNRNIFRVHSLVAQVFLNHNPSNSSLVIDHINNNPKDNRLENLQLVSHRFNVSKTTNKYTSIYTGVCWHKRHNKWTSSIQINGKRVYLGMYDSEVEAYNAYLKKLKEIENATV